METGQRKKISVPPALILRVKTSRKTPVAENVQILLFSEQKTENEVKKIIILRDVWPSAFIILHSGEEEQDMKINIAKTFRRYIKICIQAVEWEEVKQMAQVWTLWKTWEKKWKGEIAEKTTCESHIVTTDEQGREKKMQHCQVSADPRGKKRMGTEVKERSSTWENHLKTRFLYPVENHTLLFLWQIFLSNAA